MSLELPEPQSGAVALMSGGLDSAVMLGAALQQGITIWPLYVRQGFLWEDEELDAVERFLNSWNRTGARAESRGLLQPLSRCRISAPPGFGAAWALKDSEPAPSGDQPDEEVYLPGRNLALLTQAAMLAYSRGVGRILLGVLSGNPFPDARPKFFRSFERTARRAMRWRIAVETPFAALTKIEVIERGARFDLGNTLSCIRPIEGLHCGQCNKCAERLSAFALARLHDPALYAAAPLDAPPEAALQA